MNDKKLYRISVLSSVIGVIVLFAFSYTTSPDTVEIPKINTNYVGSRIQVRGTVEEKYVTEDGHLFFHVNEEDDEINVAVFKENLRKMGLNSKEVQEGDEVTVAGDVEMYEGELQILPVKIEIK